MPSKPQRISQGDGWHEAEFAEDASSYVDTFSDPATPPQVSLRKADGKLIAWIEQNKLDARIRTGHTTIRTCCRSSAR